MSFTMPDMLPALPEMFVLSMACIILLVDIFISERSRGATYILSQATLVGAMFLTIATFTTEEVVSFNNTFVRDAMADVLKVFIYGAIFIVFLYAKDYLQHRGIKRGEFYVLGLFGTLGMMVLTSAYSLLTVYLGLELLSLSLYAMVAMQRDSKIASEAAMKYFVLGAIASGMLLYGMSMVYGVTGSLQLAEISRDVVGHQNEIVLIFGLVFLIVGIAFKFGAVPFHVWIPDVYQGSATSTTLFIGSAPKIAAFAMLIRLLVDGLGSLHGQWQDILVLLSVASLALGNVLAIAQTNIKRMLAYSTISHVGFIMLGVLSGTDSGLAGAMFYTLIYTMMTLGAFGMIIFLSRKDFEAENLDDFQGLNERSPWYALLMLILMFSMAGVPPFAGFWAKLAVLKAVVDINMVWLAAVAVIFSIIGAFYYLRVIKLMYFDKPTDTRALVSPTDMRVVLSLNGLAILGLGLWPRDLLALCARVFS